MTYTQHMVQQEDTLQQLAQLYLGDMSRWEEIVETNKLKHPYIVQTPEEKVAKNFQVVCWGDNLLIETGTEENPVFSETNLNSIEKERILAFSLGKSYKLEFDNNKNMGSRDNIAQLTSNAKQELEIVSGYDNLKQALLLRLMTKRGTYMGHPRYGSDIYRYIGKRMSKTLLEKINLEIERTLKTDARVQTAELIESNIEGDHYYGAFRVTPQSLEEAFNFVVASTDNSDIILVD